MEQGWRRKINKLAVSEDWFVFGSQMVFYCLFSWGGSSEYFLVITFLWFLGCWLFLKNWGEAAWLVLVSLLPFGFGLRSWPVVYRPPLVLNISYRDVFNLSLKHWLMAYLLVWLGVDLIRRRRKPKLLGGEWLLLLFMFLLAGVTLMRGGDEYSLLGLWRFVFPLFLYFGALFFTKKKRILKLTLMIIVGAICFESFWGVGQFFKKGLLGKMVEEGLSMYSLGKVAAEDSSLFRSMGTFTDPLTYAVFLAMGLPLAMAFLAEEKPFGERKLFFGFLLMTILGLIVSFARGAWFLGAFWGGVLWLWGVRPKLTKKESKLLFWLGGLGLVFGARVFLRRLVSVVDFFYGGERSSLSVRWDLIREAWRMILNNFWWGLGLGRFMEELWRVGFTGVAIGFYYPVHNVYLWWLAELGFVLSLVFFWALGWLLMTHRGRKLVVWQKGLLFSLLIYFTLGLIYNSVIGVGTELFFVFLAIYINSFREKAI